jgi:hypothetical protein
MLNGIKAYYAKTTTTTNRKKIMNAKNYTSLTASLERKSLLESDLKTKQREASALQLKICSLNTQRINEQNAIKGYRGKGYEASLKASEEKLKSIDAELARAKHQLEVAHKEISAISAALSEFVPETSISAVLDHQQAIETEQAELDKYQALIDEQQKKISAASVTGDKVTPLIRKREELLADIALGKAKAETLEKLDSDIEQARKDQEAEQSSNKNIITDAKNTIAGLERGAESIKARIAELNHLTPSVLDYLLMGMAKQSAEEFNRLAQEMAQNLTELAALDKMISDLGKRDRSGLFPNSWWNAQIPNIGNIPPCTALNGDSVHYFNTANGTIYLMDAIHQIKQNIINQGIKI